MLLIVGLGNPGADYARNRHNVGFMALDVIHARHGFAPWRKRFHAEVSEGTLGGVKTLLLKPQTYMNESGVAVGEAAGFFKLAPTDVVVVHDEVDLPAGKVRMKAGGGSAGHNGLRSITGAIGEDYRRLRIGVGHPGGQKMVHVHVLKDFAKADTEWLVPLLDAIADNAALLAEGKDSTFANRLHEATSPEKPVKEKKKKASGLEGGSDSESEALARPEKSPAGDTAEGPLARGLKRLFGGNS
jgi:PTH1 family peptidyl-tRNA hydrolase